MAQFSFAGPRGSDIARITSTRGGAAEYNDSQQIIQDTKTKFEKEFGRPIQTNSEARSRATQQNLYDRWKAGEPGIYMPADPAKSPNAEYYHLYSMDISPSNLGPNERKWLQQNGWQLAYGARDPVHWQYVGPKNVGTKTPPTVGTPEAETAAGQSLPGSGQTASPMNNGERQRLENGGSESGASVTVRGRREGQSRQRNPTESGREPSKNILDDYANYTYGISLHYMTIEKYNSVIIKGAEYTSSDGTVLIASGGRRTADLARNPVFEHDMYFEDFKMTCVIGHNDRSRGSNVIDISFTIIEPMGMSFLDKILEVANRANIRQWDQMPFLIQIDFFANNESGAIINPIPNTTKRICVKIIDIQISINTKGGTYKITAIPQSHVGFLQTNATTPVNLEVMAKKVKDFFASDADPGESGNIAAARQSNSSPAGKQSFKTYSYTAALNSYQNQLKKLNHQKTADVYKFEFDSEIANSDIFIPEKQPTNRSPAQNDINKNQNYDRENGFIPINAGTYIKEVINYILRSSKYYRDQIVDSSASNQAGGAAKAGGTALGSSPIDSHKILTRVEYGDWDSIRKQYQKTITYKVIKYEYFNTKYPESKKGIPSRVEKEYYYLFTGKNQQILDFRIDFNTMFFTALTAMEKKTQQQNVQASKQDTETPDPIGDYGEQLIQSPRVNHVVAHTGEAQQISNMDSKYVEASDLFKSMMSNSRGDMINVELTISGDPDLIKQDDVFSNLNNSIPSDQGEIFCRLEFRMLNDIDQTRGMYVFDSKSIFSGIYKIITVHNIFERGQFVQKLDLIRLFEQPDDKKTGTSGSGVDQRELSSNGAGTSAQTNLYRPGPSAIESNDLSNSRNGLKSISEADVGRAARDILNSFRDQEARPAVISDFGY